MAPCMDNWLNLGDPNQVRNCAGLLKTLTDPTRFETYLYMPVVRDMTKGERTLLYNFLDQPATDAADPAPAVAPVTVQAAAARVEQPTPPSDPHVANLAELSRSFRS